MPDSHPSLDAARPTPGELADRFPPETEFGRYKIERVLGIGAMGGVLLATDTILSRPVALKIPVIGKYSAETLEKRFIREARAAATLSHPNLCPVYDVGTIDETFYISMGYIEGRSLANLMEEAGLLPEDEAVRIVRQVALGLQEAHDKGIVHRDLKPNNIMIDRRGEPIVMDFGLARDLEDEDLSRLTQEGMTVGTPSYMSPEQVTARVDLGPSSDQFSLGVIFYELLTGARPFTGDSVSLMGKIVYADPIPPSALREDVSPELAEVCLRMIQKQPAERFMSMQQLADVLQNYLSGNAVKLPPLVPAKTDPEQSAYRPEEGSLTDLELPAHPNSLAAKSRNILLPLLLLAVGVMLGVQFMMLVTDKDSDASGTETNAVEPVLDASVEQENSTPDNAEPEPTTVFFRGDVIEVLPFDVERLFSERDFNGDGSLTPGEFPGHIVNRADRNQDGGVTRAEFEQSYASEGDDLFRVAGPGEGPQLGEGPPPRRRGAGDPGQPRFGDRPRPRDRDDRPGPPF